MSGVPNEMPHSQMLKASSDLGTPGASPAVTLAHPISQYASPHGFPEDQDLGDFSNYTAPAFDDDLFHDQFGPMLNLDDDEDSYNVRDESHQTSNVNHRAEMFAKNSNVNIREPDRSIGTHNLNVLAGKNDPLLDEEDDRHQGVEPTQRAAMNEAPVLTLHEQEEQRQLEDKKADVERWLTKSTAGSDNEDDEGVAKEDSAEADATTEAESRSSLPGSFDENTLMNEIPSSTIKQRQDSVQDLPKGFKSRFWQDSPVETDAPPLKSQPSSSNAAIYRFEQRARDIETASRTATIGSRRRSLDSLFSAAGISVRVPTNEEHEHAKANLRTSLLNRVLPKRSNSNLKKRKGTQLNEVTQPNAHEKSRKDGGTGHAHSVPIWAKPLAPGLETAFSPSKSALSPKSPNSLAPPTGPWAQARNVIRRTRSRTEADRPSLLASMWTQQGGPPVPSLRSPANDTTATPSGQKSMADAQDDSDRDADGEEDGSFESIISKMQQAPSSATYEGFKAHAQDLSPRLPSYMVERITQEQLRRYKKLVEFRIKHLTAVSEGHCSAGQRCIDLGGGPISVPLRSSGRNSDAPSVGFHIPANITPEDGSDQIGDGTTIAAHFPPGVPIPPVQLLPAEFECPLCFQVKQISKPSDWTKHVHEDVQPFTCTFPDCGEPKSFKRKADWVRHENERHRQLEKWVCNFHDCVHVCYRKDNFVQHLVREHKLPEPRIRAARSAGSIGSVPGGAPSTVQLLLQSCRFETAKKPQDEPCRFCGITCITWKKLTVHLAKHMEELSMPVLTLVSEASITKDTVMSPMEERSSSLRPTMASPSEKSRHSGQSRSRSPGGITGRTHHADELDIATSAIFNSHSGATYPPPNPTLPPNSQAFNTSIDSNPIPHDFLIYNSAGYISNNNHLSTNLQMDPHNNLLSPMDGTSSYYGSYGSSGSSNAYLSDPPLQHYSGNHVTSNPATLSQQPVFASPVDNTGYTFDFDNSHGYAPTSNSASYPQYPVNSADVSGQLMDYQTMHAYAQQGTFSSEQTEQPRFQGSTYPPQNLPSQRPTYQPQQGAQAQSHSSHESHPRYG